MERPPGTPAAAQLAETDSACRKETAMTRINVDLNAIGIREVLAGLSFPARRWEIIAEAHYYGADAGCVAELARLPVGVYPNVAAVAGELKQLRAAARMARMSARPPALPARSAAMPARSPATARRNPVQTPAREFSTTRS